MAEIGSHVFLFICLLVEQPFYFGLTTQIFLVGLILQLVSFLIFSCVYAVFLYRIYTRQQQTWFMDERDGKPWYDDWRALAGALVLSCLCILVSRYPIFLNRYFNGLSFRSVQYTVP